MPGKITANFQYQLSCPVSPEETAEGLTSTVTGLVAAVKKQLDDAKARGVMRGAQIDITIRIDPLE